MTSFAVLVKSHAPDLPYCERLLASYARHNVHDLPLFLVVPDADAARFAHLGAGQVHVLPESTFGGHLTSTDIAGFSAGYINQEVIKLCFWEAGLADNYLCLDSDAEFIRDFGPDDFMADSRTPYTFLSEDAALRAEPEYYRDHWTHREPRLRAIQNEIGIVDTRILTVHGQAVFSAVVLASFRDDFLAARSWDYLDALAIAPYEPTWYCMWLQHSRTIDVVMREPVFKTFHNAAQHIDYLLQGITAHDAARGYVGVIVNSNYSRGAGVINFGDSRAKALAAYVPESVLLRSALRSAGRRLTPRRRAVPDQGPGQ